MTVESEVRLRSFLDFLRGDLDFFGDTETSDISTVSSSRMEVVVVVALVVVASEPEHWEIISSCELFIII